MGLIAWYPLNGDTTNYIKPHGDLVNSGATISNSGKIGKCYEFTSTNSNLNVSITLPEQSYTFCAWGYLTTTTVSCMLFSLNNTSGPDLYFTEGVVCWNVGDGASNPFKIGSTSATIPEANKWHHFVVISNKEMNTVELYINGIYKGKASYRPVSSSKIFLGNYVNGSGYPLRGRMNDFRIYDHVLSLAEILELKRAKILHYTFQRMVQPKPNVANQSYAIYNNYASTGVTGTVTALGTYYKGMPVYRMRMSATTAEGAANMNSQSLGSKGVYNASNISLTEDSKWVFSTYFKPVTHNNIRVGGTASNIGGWTATSQQSLGDGWYVVGQHRSTAPPRTDSIFTSWYVPNSNFAVGAVVEIDFACPMIVKGDNQIPDDFIHPDRTYVDIQDCSGYKNHANNISASNFAGWETKDVPRNFAKYKFNGTNTIQTNQLFFDNINQSWSINCWVYISETCDNAKLNNWNAGNILQQTTTKKGLLYLNGGENDSYTYSSNTFPMNTWFMVTYVHNRDNLACKIYKDGAAYGSSTNYTSSDIPSGFSSSTIFGQGLKGYMADLRVYANQLNESEIMELYNAPVSIDSMGNISASYFTSGVYTDNALKGVNKKGEVAINNIEEAFTPGLTYVKDDANRTQSIECRWNASSKQMEYKGTVAFSCMGHNVTTNWGSSPNPKIFKQRVILQYGDTIKCNEANEMR
ncbi:MAG: LamG-like jellyroll fold domain-containing protein [Bacteroidales bacterium]